MPAKLSHLDLDGDGIIDVAEITSLSVKLYTDYGFVLLTNSSFTVVDRTDLGVFADAGFTSGKRVEFSLLDLRYSVRRDERVQPTAIGNLDATR